MRAPQVSHPAAPARPSSPLHQPLDESASGSDIPRLRPGTWILVVEDDDDVRRLLSTALTEEGYFVDEAVSAEDGLELLHGFEYDLILTDYALPRRTGAWLLQTAFRTGLHPTPALMITAHADPPSVPGVTVLQKPLDIEMFLSRVREAIESVR